MRIELVADTLLVTVLPPDDNIWTPDSPAMEIGRVVMSQSELEVGEVVFFPSSAGMEINAGKGVYKLLHASNILLKANGKDNA